MNKETWGYLSLAVSIAGYIPYFHSIISGKSKPHVFSWIVWSWASCFLFVAQFLRGAGAGAWVTGITALASVLVMLLSLKYGEKSITHSDETVFGLSLAALPLWVITESPLWSVVLLVGICAFGFFPTFRKSYDNPHEELAVFYLSNVFKFLFGFLALENYAASTALYPVYGVLANGAFVAMLLWRRNSMIRVPGHIVETESVSIATSPSSAA